MDYTKLSMAEAYQHWITHRLSSYSMDKGTPGNSNPNPGYDNYRYLNRCFTRMNLFQRNSGLDELPSAPDIFSADYLTWKSNMITHSIKLQDYISNILFSFHNDGKECTGTSRKRKVTNKVIASTDRMAKYLKSLPQ
jgi:hypothetical protein